MSYPRSAATNTRASGCRRLLGARLGDWAHQLPTKSSSREAPQCPARALGLGCVAQLWQRGPASHSAPAQLWLCLSSVLLLSLSQASGTAQISGSQMCSQTIHSGYQEQLPSKAAETAVIDKQARRAASLKCIPPL